MLRVIEPQHHSSLECQIDSLLDLLKIYQGFELSLKERARSIFIIAHDTIRGVYGGAVFYPQKVKDLTDKIKQEILLILEKNHTVWCSSLCLCLPMDEKTLDMDTLALRDLFYIDLYRIFCELGKKKRTNCLPLALSNKDYQYSIRQGHWFYFMAKPVRNGSKSSIVSSILYLIDKKRIARAVESAKDRLGKRTKLSSPSLPANDQPPLKRYPL